MSSENDIPNLVEAVVNDPVSHRLVVIAEKRSFFSGKKERNND
jgi:hypothetical protein